MKITYLLLVSFFCCDAVWADELLTQVEKKYQTAKSVQMQVKKTLKIELLGKEKISDGTISIRRGGYFKWVIKSPEKQEIYLTPKLVWIADFPQDATEKPNVLKLKKPQKNQSPAVVAFLMGKGQLSKNFKVTHKETVSEKTIYSLKAKSAHEIVQELVVSINMKEKIIVNVEFKDAIGNKTHLEFLGITFNLPMAKKDFEFVPPKGANISTLN